MMKPIELRWCLVPMACLLVAAVVGCEKEPQAPAPPKVVVKKIAVAQKATKPATKPAPAKAKATKVAAAPAKAATVPEQKPAAPSAKQAQDAVKSGSASVSAEKGQTSTVAAVPSTGLAAAEPSSDAGKQKPSGIEDLAALTRPRIYNPAGRVNPFTPLFEKKPETQTEEKEPQRRKRKVRVPQTPLEKVDLDQLKLVAIMHMQSGPRALVEESSGKGYVVRKGTYMGLHSGQVVEIAGERLIVEEEVENLLGDFEIKKRELKLQKPLGD